MDDFVTPGAGSWACLTPLSEATIQNDCPGFQNGPPRHIETPHGSEGRMAPAACSWSCLTSLADAARN